MSNDAPPLPTTFITPASWTETLRIGECFPTAQPMEVDLGCGKGRFLLARAAGHPDRNFLGVDRLLVRLRKVDRRIVRRGLPNVRLLRIESAYALTHLIPPQSVTVFYVFFPDPWPKRRHHPRRLFSTTFLASVRRTLVNGGVIHTATDHADYGAYIRKCFAADPAFTSIPPFEPVAEERTDFECLFVEQGLTIHRSSYQLNPAV
ncbi:MAG: tRNA (guanosine(46)-N7)-methyltransferase TrmB [Lentisphaerae bacterium]|nr:tRNA (guanosine(46)-N7)-methyltransferase TrmB [Lentisphaerota bacterium]